MSKKKSITTRKKRAPEKTTKGGTRVEQFIALLRAPNGASIAELTKATGWQPHSVRGFLSGTLRKKLKLPVKSIKIDGERRYQLS